MRYTRVYVDAFGYELPPVVITTAELEERLAPLYEKLHVARGQLEHITGIAERRWWQPAYPLSDGAAAAGRKALRAAGIEARDVEALIYGAVCREHFEPATACRVAAELGVGGRADVFDVSNACLGVVNGMVEIANRIELGQVRAGMVVACETAREINDVMIERMLRAKDMRTFTTGLATLTGGSGAVAVVLTDGSYSAAPRRRLLGGVRRSAPEHHGLCIWGLAPEDAEEVMLAADARSHSILTPFTCTDSASVLKYGVELGGATWRDFLEEMGWTAERVDRVICHQVGSGHQEAVLKAIGLSAEKDFPTYPFLGNVGTVSLPISAAIAEERGALRPGQRVGFLGIGSGLNCVMLGLEW